MRRVHDPFSDPANLLSTVWGLGVRGIISPGALAWQTYPIAAPGATVLPGLVDAADGVPVGVLGAGLVPAPHYVTHIAGIESNRDGGRIGRWKLQDNAGNNLRVFRFQSPGKLTGGVRFGLAIVEEMLAFQMPAGAGVQIVAAMDNNSFDIVERCYITAIIVEPSIVPALLTKAPTSQGAVLPTTAAGTVLTSGATAWTFGAYVQLTAGLGTGALITGIVSSSQSVNDAQIAFATGGAGSEIDWGIFPWAEALGTTLSSTRLSLIPFPFYLPAGVRLAARARYGNPADTFNVGVEYLPIPLR